MLSPHTQASNFRNRLPRMETDHTVCKQHAHWNPYRAFQYSALRGFFGSVVGAFFFGGGGGVCFLPHTTLSLSVFIPWSTHSKYLSKASLTNHHIEWICHLTYLFIQKTAGFYSKEI